MLTGKESNDILSKLSGVVARRDLKSALELHEQLLRESSVEFQCQSYWLLGWLKEKLGDEAGAKEEWFRGIEITEEGWHIRAIIHEFLGSLAERLNNRTDALMWYRAALQTCDSGDDFSAVQELAGLLRMSDGKVNERDRELVVAVVKKSWLIQELPGTPDLTNLEASILELDSCFAAKRSSLRDEEE